MIRALILYGFIASLLPAAGILLGEWVLDGVRAGEAVAAPGMPRWSTDCFPGHLPSRGLQRRGCMYYLSGFGVHYLGLALAVAISLNTMVPFLAAAWTGRDPFRMARCFGWVSGLFLTVWGLLAVPRFLIVLGLAFLLRHWMESQVWADWVVTMVFMAILVPAGMIAFTQLGAPFRFRRRPQPSVSLGCAVERTEAPELYGFVGDIARRLGVTPPAWLAVTIDTGFSVTDGPVLLPDLEEPLEGGVMSLSLPMLRVLTGEEVAGIIAHEIGHLDDPVSQAKTAWGPPYSAFVSEMHAGTVWGLSANWHLGIVPALFDVAVTEALHQSEANADAATLRVTRREAAVLAFMKAVVVEEATAEHAERNFERLEEGVAVGNLSVEAAEFARKALANIDVEPLVARIREDYGGNPVEPSVEQRIGNFGMTLADAAALLARHAGKGTPAAVGDLTLLEERATRNVHRFQQALAGEPGPLPPEEVESMAVFLGD